MLNAELNLISAFPSKIINAKATHLLAMLVFNFIKTAYRQWGSINFLPSKYFTFLSIFSFVKHKLKWMFQMLVAYELIISQFINFALELISYSFLEGKTLSDVLSMLIIDKIVFLNRINIYKQFPFPYIFII